MPVCTMFTMKSHRSSINSFFLFCSPFLSFGQMIFPCLFLTFRRSVLTAGVAVDGDPVLIPLS